MNEPTHLRVDPKLDILHYFKHRRGKGAVWVVRTAGGGRRTTQDPTFSGVCGIRGKHLEPRAPGVLRKLTCKHCKSYYLTFIGPK